MGESIKKQSREISERLHCRGRARGRPGQEQGVEGADSPVAARVGAWGVPTALTETGNLESKLAFEGDNEI